MLTKEARCAKILEVYKEILANRDDSFNLGAILCLHDPIVVLNAVGLLCAQANTFSYAIGQQQVTPSDEIGKTVAYKQLVDTPDVLTQNAAAILQYYSKHCKPKTRTLAKSPGLGIGKKARRSFQGVYSAGLSEKTKNRACASMLMPYYTHRLQVAQDFLSQLSDTLLERIEIVDVKRDLERRISAELHAYVDTWNSKNPLMGIKCVHEVDVNIDWANIRTSFRNTNGKVFMHVHRNIANWIMDGTLSGTYDVFEGNVKLDEWHLALSSPSVWITLDNYESFNSDDVSILPVDSHLIGDNADIRALAIGHPDSEIYDRKIIFFKKKESSFVPLNSNKLEAHRLVERMKLMRQMIIF